MMTEFERYPESEFIRRIERIVPDSAEASGATLRSYFICAKIRHERADTEKQEEVAEHNNTQPQQKPTPVSAYKSEKCAHNYTV